MASSSGEHPGGGGVSESQVHQGWPLLRGSQGAHRRLRPQQARGEEGDITISVG
jgi:hypothetical protein